MFYNHCADSIENNFIADDVSVFKMKIRLIKLESTLGNDSLFVKDLSHLKMISLIKCVKDCSLRLEYIYIYQFCYTDNEK